MKYWLNVSMSPKILPDFETILDLWGARHLLGIQSVSGESDTLHPDHLPNLRKDEFWAARDISFELKRGECLGLIGHNGAGKSTLLKMLNGLFKPDHGCITMKGRIGALIELNVGFNPVLTGRENVYIYGAILGFSRKEIDEKYDAIVEFAELPDFMEMPFRSYSSGMKVRLGFAVAAQMEPDVLIIDEVLAVGDVGFRNKCYKTIDKLSKESAIIFVSHNMNQIDRMCNNVLLLSNGAKVLQGTCTHKAITKYITMFGNKNGQINLSENFHIRNILINNKPYDSINEHKQASGQAFNIEFNFTVDYPLRSCEASLSILSQSLDLLAQTKQGNIITDSDAVSIKILIPSLELANGAYYLSLVIRDPNNNYILCWMHAFTRLLITSDNFNPAPYNPKSIWTIS